MLRRGSENRLSLAGRSIDDAAIEQPSCTRCVSENVERYGPIIGIGQRRLHEREWWHSKCELPGRAVAIDLNRELVPVAREIHDSKIGTKLRVLTKSGGVATRMF